MGYYGRRIQKNALKRWPNRDFISGILKQSIFFGSSSRGTFHRWCKYDDTYYACARAAKLGGSLVAERDYKLSRRTFTSGLLTNFLPRAMTQWNSKSCLNILPTSNLSWTAFLKRTGMRTHKKSLSKISAQFIFRDTACGRCSSTG